MAKKDNGSGQKLTITHQRSGAYRSIYAEGSLVRIARGVVSILFTTDETMIESEEAESVNEQIRPTGQLVRTPVRIEEATVRMPLDAAVLSALNILEQVKRNRPDVLEAMKLNIDVAVKKPDQPAS